MESSLTHRFRGHRRSSSSRSKTAWVGISALSLAIGAQPADAARKKKAAVEKPFVDSPKPGEYGSSELGSVVTRAALNLAVQAGATLGRPTCPSGVKRSPTMAAQCLITFDAITAPYTVTTTAVGSLVAAPVFLVIPRRLLESELRNGAGTATASCGKASVIVVPSGATVRCQFGKQDLEVQVFSTAVGWRIVTSPK